MARRGQHRDPDRHGQRAEQSSLVGERSALTANGLPVYPLKALIPVAGSLLLLQGLAEMLRCVACIRSGFWAPRSADVQEVDVERLRQQTLGNVHADATPAGSRP